MAQICVSILKGEYWLEDLFLRKGALFWEVGEREKKREIEKVRDDLEEMEGEQNTRMIEMKKGEVEHIGNWDKYIYKVIKQKYVI